MNSVIVSKLNYRPTDVEALPRFEQSPSAPLPTHSLVIIDKRELDRQCLAQCMAAQKADACVLAFGSIEEWKLVRDQHPPLLAILLSLGGKKLDEPAVSQQIKNLSSEFASTPVIVLADSDDFSQIAQALEYGAKGYIPTLVSMSVCLELIALSVAGGVFVPASTLFEMRRLMTSSRTATHPLSGMFTDRQAEVIEAIRRGKANKIIAYELKLRESTVKVHVRNIMKKLKATNRTEVLFKLNDLLSDGLAGAPAPIR